ncbi:solute carrier family 66 member 3-like [Daphnia pulicaria]|uniref:solute carrier family 66 member 3-like n=1 Tax=Daphnia pulicaria TaxID=35523 RepID=UPI001EEC6015|nr:solute carrier family 66 member 3-like [Daphnia pulicaria]
MADLYSLSLSFANISKTVLCVVLKLPQIISLVNSKSTTGLSLSGTLLELTSFTIGLCYNVFSDYALSSYLEYPILVGQVLLLLALLLHYSRRIGPKWLAAFGVYSAVVYALSTGMFPCALLVTLMSLCTPLSAASRLVQIRTMHVSQNSESVSVLTWSIAVYTCVMRIFITLDRGFDAPLLANYSVSLILNLAVITLALKLRRPSKKDEKIE